MLILLLSRTFVRTYGILKQYAMRLCNGKKRIDKYNNGADKHSMRGHQKKNVKNKNRNNENYDEDEVYYRCNSDSNSWIKRIQEQKYGQ